MFGLTDAEMKRIQSLFSQFEDVKEVLLYGSRAKGNHRKNSDIDFTLKGDHLTLDVMYQIEEKLDDLLLPYKIDLSIFNKIESKELINHIQRVGVSFFKST
jgi:type I restriction enzyme S subunit